MTTPDEYAYVITKHLSFSASHILSGMPEGHQCGRLHGHNYEIDITIKCSSLDKNGFVFDFTRLSAITKRYDHQHLNDLLPINPTAENLAQLIVRKIDDDLVEDQDQRRFYIEATVSETPTSTATYFERVL